MEGCGDGTWNGVRYFNCQTGHSIFFPLSSLTPDQRFAQTATVYGNRKYVYMHLDVDIKAHAPIAKTARNHMRKGRYIIYHTHVTRVMPARQRTWHHGSKEPVGLEGTLAVRQSS